MSVAIYSLPTIFCTKIANLLRPATSASPHSPSESSKTKSWQFFLEVVRFHPYFRAIVSLFGVTAFNKT